ncbi:hypothetical protein FB451DRAFT_1385784 [Mycena latifolia]|nr:hypothetical protein FB451DRAFT_1385784 [Mycena latifolia]
MNEAGPLDIFAQIRAGEEAVLRQGLATTDKHRAHGDFRMRPPRAVLAIATEYIVYGYTVVHAMHYARIRLGDKALRVFERVVKHKI